MSVMPPPGSLSRMGNGIKLAITVVERPSTPLRYAQDERSRSKNVEQFPLMLSPSTALRINSTAAAAKSKHET
jgi:hypothetical protein